MANTKEYILLHNLQSIKLNILNNCNSMNIEVHKLFTEQKRILFIIKSLYVIKEEILVGNVF